MLLWVGDDGAKRDRVALHRVKRTLAKHGLCGSATGRCWGTIACVGWATLAVPSEGLAEDKPLPRRSLGDTEVSVTYEGGIWPDSTVQQAARRVNDAWEPSVALAESRLGLALDRTACSIVLDDMPTKPTSITPTMNVTGYGKVRITVHVEPLLRGTFFDQVTLERALAHETVHAIVRQRCEPARYSAIPEWFQEGLPTFLCDQGQGKFAARLLDLCQQRDELLKGFDDGRSEAPITGYCVMLDLASRLGEDGLRSLAHDVVVGVSVDEAIAARGLKTREVLKSAKDRAGRLLDELSREGGGELCACMDLYKQGIPRRQDTLKCFRDLSERSSPAGTLAVYWTAKQFWHMGDFPEAQAWFQRYREAGDICGLLDDVVYYEMLAGIEQSASEEAVSDAEAYLRWFPDGLHRVRVEEELFRLRTRERQGG